MKEYSKTFCVYPWIELMINTSGTFDYCCLANPSQLKDKNNNQLKINKDSLKDVWNSDAMKDIRKNMIEGNKIKSCNLCYLQEDSGRKSYRQLHNSEWEHLLGSKKIEQIVDKSIENNLEVDTPPVYLDLRMGNTCNLKCRMCNPFNSSLITKEHFKLFDKSKTYANIFKKNFGSNPEWLNEQAYRDQFNDKKIWKEIYEVLPTLEKLYLTGGEPTLIKNNIKVLEKLIELNKQNNTKIFLNTNCTYSGKNFLELLSKFKEMDINPSIDGVGEVNNYIRGSKKWENIYQNCKNILSVNNKISANITPVLQIYNLNKIHEILNLANDITYELFYNPWTKELTNTIGVDILFNTHPFMLDVRNLPLELRQNAIQRLLDFKNEYVFEFSFMIRNTIEGTVGYLKQPQLENYKQNLKDFIDYTEILDKERNQSFNDIDKELYTEIKKIAR